MSSTPAGLMLWKASTFYSNLNHRDGLQNQRLLVMLTEVLDVHWVPQSVPSIAQKCTKVEVNFIINLIKSLQTVSSFAEQFVWKSLNPEVPEV